MVSLMELRSLKFSTPKLIEIEMIHGTFQPGEDVRGDMNNGGVVMFNSDSTPVPD